MNSPKDDEPHSKPQSPTASQEDAARFPKPPRPLLVDTRYAYRHPPPSAHRHPPSPFAPPRFRGHGFSPYRTIRNIQSVVTTSFSGEDREDVGGYRYRREYPESRTGKHAEQRENTSNDDREKDVRGDRREDYEHSLAANTKPPAAFRPPEGYNHIQRAYSSGASSSFRPPKQLKRNFYHHVNPENAYSSVPADFAPPKRTKTDDSVGSQDNLARVSQASGPSLSQEWYQRTPSWEVEYANFQHLSRVNSMPMPPPWPHAPHPPPSPSVHYNMNVYKDYAPPESPSRPRPTNDEYRSTIADFFPPPSDFRSPASAWHQPSPGGWHHSSPRQYAQKYWPSSRYSQERDDKSSEDNWTGSRDEIEYHMQSTQPTVNRDRYTVGNNLSDADMSAYSQESNPHINVQQTPELMLLALPSDATALSETLCIVRENIEIFVATQSDVDAPAPGRKHAVTVGQVGLRCIHCRHTTKCSDRVKRAVCYPSSIKRIYRTVIDMKLDHFCLCKYVPDALKERLDKLKAVHTRSTGTTMQYFIKCAHSMGMYDGPLGVRLASHSKPEHNNFETAPLVVRNDNEAPRVKRLDGMSHAPQVAQVVIRPREVASQRSGDSMSAGSFDTMATDSQTNDTGVYFPGMCPLALPEDKASLSSLRCFLREQICAFTATSEDISSRAPTTFSITEGQVGIGCIHCVKRRPELRSNRAVCFPFSIARIYQSVADIQRFHFNECKSLPENVKKEFLRLQSASSKGSKGLATRQYWVASAKKIGMVDTSTGIRFVRDPTKPEANKAMSLDILAQAAFNVTTASKKLVLPEDKPFIAGFLYVVMEQLQPCRFTEADRNKRRLKNVGCIGVECRHCAGQVDSRKFFWSSVSAVESNFVSVHTHMLECQSIPEDLRSKLVELKRLRKEQTALLKSGSQKAFFARVWDRLHSADNDEKTVVEEIPDSAVSRPVEDGSTDDKMSVS